MSGGQPDGGDPMSEEHEPQTPASDEDDGRPMRRHERVSVHVPVRVSTIDPEHDTRTGRPYFRASRETCANLSAGGAFIRTTDPLSPGRRILIEIHVPESEPIEAIGRVAWSKTVLAPGGGQEEAGVGVEFVGGGDEAATALERHLERVGQPEEDPGGRHEHGAPPSAETQPAADTQRRTR